MNFKFSIISAGVLFFIGQSSFAQKSKSDTLEQKIEEVVVVAYGKQKKETIVGSNTQIKSDQFATRPITSISSVLDGAAPGISITAGSGQPGSSSTIRIRGFTSINAGNNPLYVVDGVPILGRSQDFDISSLNPNDIETVNVLKDAASTSLYGSSAANGVVLITTKKGKAGRDVINFSTSTGISSRGIPEYNRVDQGQYYVLAWESLRNGYLTTNPTATLAVANAYASNNLIPVLKTNIYKNVPDNQIVVDGVLFPNAEKKYNDFDWQKDLFKTGLRQTYDLNYSGGTKKSKYFASVGYLNDKGYIVNSDYERFTARLSTDTQIRDWLKVGLNLNGVNTYANNAVDGADNNSSLVNPYYFTRRMGPIYSPYLHNPDGSIMYDTNGDVVYDYTTTRGGSAYTGRNAILENLLNKDFTKAYNINSRAYAEFKFWKDFTFTLNGAYDTRATYNRSYTNKIVGDSAPAGSASRTSRFFQTTTFNQLLNYKKKWNSHNFEVLLGHESNRFRYEYFYGRKQGEVSPNNDDLINFITPTSLTSSTDNYNKESYFSRFNYDYSEKYLISASFRRDATSKFAADTRWHGFWSFGAGWNVHKENFANDLNWLDQFKLRGSYGEVGNENGINYYAYQAIFDLGYNNATEPGILYGTFVDKNVTWESNNQTDIGVDFSFLKKRISGSVEWYKRDTDGLLFDVDTPFSAGVPLAKYTTNIGAMYNKGWEFNLNLGVVRNQNFGWDLAINASTLKNEVTKLPPGQKEIISGTKKIMVGHSMLDYWLLQWYGVDPSNGEGLFLLRDDLVANGATVDNRQINGVWVTRRSANAKYDYSGTAIPDVYGSINNVFRYKNLTLSALMTYQIGGKIYDSNYAQLMNGTVDGTALSTDILTRWQNPGDITNVPSLNSSLSAQYGVASSRWLIDASYFSIRSATLSYTFNNTFTDVFGFTSAKIYLSGENLYSKTKRKGLEPQENFSGTTTNRYTPARIFSFGVNVSF